MAALSISTSDVQPVSGVTYGDGTAGADLTAGMTVYESTASTLIGTINSSAVAKAAIKGVMANDAKTGQPGRYFTGGTITLGSVMTQGVAYYAGATAGSIDGTTGIATTKNISLVGIASSTANLVLNIFNSGATKP